MLVAIGAWIKAKPVDGHYLSDVVLLDALATWIAEERLARGATSYNVCPSRCPFSRIQDAVNVAGREEIIAVGPGTYCESLEIAKVCSWTGRAGQPSLPTGPDRRLAGNATARIKGFPIAHRDGDWGVLVSE